MYSLRREYCARCITGEALDFSPGRSAGDGRVSWFCFSSLLSMLLSAGGNDILVGHWGFQMILLNLGVLLWAGAHLSSSFRTGIRQGLIDKMGPDKYRGLFSLVILLSVAMIVFGWRSTDTIHLYDPPLWNSPLTSLLVGIAFLLMAGAGYGGNIRRIIRHPQLTGVVVWAGAHLLANGDNRSAILFGGLGLWALVSMLVISKRDGAWVKPSPMPLSRELIGIAITIAVFATVFYLHPYFTGMKIHVG